MALGVEAASHCSARVECTNAAIYRIDWRNLAIHRGRTMWLARRSPVLPGGLLYTARSPTRCQLGRARSDQPLWDY